MTAGQRGERSAQVDRCEPSGFNRIPKPGQAQRCSSLHLNPALLLAMHEAPQHRSRQSAGHQEAAAAPHT